MTGLGTTPAPANQPEPQAASATKSPPQTIRELENALRELGYSQKQAKAIAGGGFRAITNGVQDDEFIELAARIKSIAGRT